MEKLEKELVIVGGANGSGKTTFAWQLAEEKNLTFVNADEIKKELKTNNLAAGKTFFKHFNQYLEEGRSFILESTLSGVYLLKFIEKAKACGYIIQLFYVYLENPQECIHRIQLRVNLGGHHIPDEDVTRRYYRSIKNFWRFYKNEVDVWVILYNSTNKEPLKIAEGFGETFAVEQTELFQELKKTVGNAS